MGEIKVVILGASGYTGAELVRLLALHPQARIAAMTGDRKAGQAMATAFAVARPGAMVGYVGVPHGVEVPLQRMFLRNVGLHGGSAPVRAYIPELMEDVLAGRIDPGRVFDFETDLDGIQEAYAAMDERRAIKSLVRVGTL